MAKKSAPAPGISVLTLNTAILFAVVAGSKAGNMTYVSQAEGEGLVAAGFIEVNPAMPDPNDPMKFAARATDAGMKQADEMSEGSTAVEAPAKAKPTFTIRDDVPLAARRGGGGSGPRESIYPFDMLNVGQSFHVAKSATIENPSRTMATAVSQAVRKHATEDGFEVNEDGTPKLNKAGDKLTKWKPTKVFTVRAVGKDDPDGEGARIYRTA